MNKGKPCRKLRAGRETMPGMGPRHLASRLGLQAGRGGGGCSSPGEQAGHSQREVAMAAGWPCHEQNVENASGLPQHVPQRKQLPGREQEQAGCPGPPPRTC